MEGGRIFDQTIPDGMKPELWQAYKAWAVITKHQAAEKIAYNPYHQMPTLVLADCIAHGVLPTTEAEWQTFQEKGLSLEDQQLVNLGLASLDDELPGASVVRIHPRRYADYVQRQKQQQAADRAWDDRLKNAPDG